MDDEFGKGNISIVEKQRLESDANLARDQMVRSNLRLVVSMLEAGSGSIINVASVLSFDVIPERAAYCAAKAGAIHLSKSIALDYGPQGIRCNALAPGAFHTALLEQSMIDSGDYEGTKAVLSGKSVFGRMGEHEELARAALFLASDDSSFVTGSVLNCDGGWFLG